MATAVATFDAAINLRLENAASNAEARYWWERKVVAKRALAALSPVAARVRAMQLAQELEAAE
jgi:hypothetical protein